LLIATITRQFLLNGLWKQGSQFDAVISVCILLIFALFSALAVVMGTLGLYPMSSSTSSIMRGVADILKSRPENVPTKSPFSSNRNPMKFPLLVVDLNIRPVFWSDTPEDIMKQEIMSFAQGSDLIKLTDEVLRQ
jgi:hypothetical protein